ncbi:MAG: tRNA (adenosine(37)-N6)-threonylcarbamoyltransferase complex dimerization subunit type 1 TsaB [Calditrichia bacterium]
MKRRAKQALELSSQPLLLLLDTSTPTCVCGLSRGETLLAETTLAISNGHSEHLAGIVDHLLQLFNNTVHDIEAIALSAGPGSFTGLRIGYSYAKGLAHAANLPIIEIPTLQLWASEYTSSKRIMMPVVDARRGDIYTALYRNEQEKLISIKPPQILAIADITTFISEPVSCIGGAASSLQEVLAPALPEGSEILRSSSQVPHASVLAKLAHTSFSTSTFSDVAECEPHYMRPFQGIM